MLDCQKIIGALACVTMLTACGVADYTDHRTEAPQDSDQTGVPGDPTNAQLQGIVRGRWVVDMRTDDQQRLFVGVVSSDPVINASRGSSNQPISGTVDPAITFSVSNANMSTPPATGQASYGSLDVTALSDNQLRVCGAAGGTKCRKGMVRIYTTGTRGAGLWSDVEKIGLPITTGTTVIGLGASRAAAVAETAIAPTQSILKLTDFTAATSLAIPISVDFTGAAAGTYATTLVVEYLVNL